MVKNKATLEKPVCSNVVPTKESILERIKTIKHKQQACRGLLETVRFRVFGKQIEQLQEELRQLEPSSISANITDAVCNKPTKIVAGKKRKTRLYPKGWQDANMQRIPHAKNPIFHNWEKTKSFKSRADIVFKENTPDSRVQPVDVCTNCSVARIVDKDTSRTICPCCGDCRTLASYVFETQDWDREEVSSNPGSNSSHLQLYALQFKKGFPEPPLELLASLSYKLNKYHGHDACKVQRANMVEALKTVPRVASRFRRSTERLIKEMTSAPIPEFTQLQLTKVINQKNKLQNTRDISGDLSAGGTDKSCNNQMYMRHFGLANGMQNAQLFSHAKTVKNHRVRCAHLEAACLQQASMHGGQKVMHWILAPFS